MAKSRSIPPSASQKRLAAERAAAARERIQTAQRRRRLWVIAAAVGTVVVVVAAFVVIKLVVGNDTLKSGKKSAVATASITQTLEGIPASSFDKIGIGDASAYPKVTSQKALGTSKPEILYVGAEFCPICAAERWPLAVALARFGTFSHLGTTSSSPTDTNPNTPTLTFHGATYTSKYLTFVGKEIETNQVVNGHYTSLDKLTAGEEKLFTAAGSSFPYLNFNGAFVLNTWQYDGKVLSGMTQAQVARAIANTSTSISKYVLGSANVLTARICQLTKDQPAAVCSSSGVTTAAAALKKVDSGS